MRVLGIVIGIAMLFVSVGGMAAAFLAKDPDGGIFWAFLLALALGALWHLLELEWTDVDEEEDHDVGSDS